MKLFFNKGWFTARARRRVVLIEKESFGGPVINYKKIENYPGFSQGIGGSQRVTAMVEQATNGEGEAGRSSSVPPIQEDVKPVQVPQRLHQGGWIG
jgi:thioredoxin reductase (NADPH)